MVLVIQMRLMCRYGGRLDVSNNKLSYEGGHAKIIYVFNSYSDMLKKLVKACNGPVTEFKYQLPHCVIPITVNNENDFFNLWHEYNALRDDMDPKKPPLIQLFI